MDKFLFKLNKTQLCMFSSMAGQITDEFYYRISVVGTRKEWWKEKKNITASPDRVKSQATLPLVERRWTRDTGVLTDGALIAGGLSLMAQVEYIPKYELVDPDYKWNHYFPKWESWKQLLFSQLEYMIFRERVEMAKCLPIIFQLNFNYINTYFKHIF